MNVIQPFKTEVDFVTGALSSADYIVQRRLSDMALMYADKDEAARILADEGDRLIYEVQGVDLPQEEGQIPHCTTRILPGHIGGEFHMTKGHYHARREQGEVYFGLSGRGYLVLQTETGEYQRALRWWLAAPPTCRRTGRTAPSMLVKKTSYSSAFGKLAPVTITARSSAMASASWLCCATARRLL